MILLLLIVLALLGTPLFVIIAASAMGNFHAAEISLQVVAIEFFGLASQPFLVAIPLFTLAGFLLAESRAPARLVHLTRSLLGWMPAGLAVVCLVACALFTAFTGGSGITIIALGALLMPALVSDGYQERFSLGMITSAGSLGLLFAPSLPLILFGVVALVPIRDLFLAGALPGTLMVLVLVVYSLWACRPGLATRPFSSREAWMALRGAAWEVPLPLFVLGGIYGGFFAISEAAAVTVLYVFVVEVLIRREITFRRLPSIMRDSSVLVGAILLVLGLSQASTNFMIDAGIPQKLLDWISGFVSGELSFILLLIVFLLLLGALLDIFSALVLIVPLILPAAAVFGLEPVHLGILFLATMELGYITPPVGLNLFIASYRFDQPIIDVYRSTIPFFLVMLAAVLIIAFWPPLSLWLPSALDSGASR